MTSITSLILVNLIGLVLANLDPSFGSDFGSDFGTLFGLPNPIAELNSTANSSESPSNSVDFPKSLSESVDFPKSSPESVDYPKSSPSNKQFDLNPSLDAAYLNDRNARILSPGLNYPVNYPSANYNTNFATDQDQPDQHSDNCTINPCSNGFCMLNQSNPLGYACFCKGKVFSLSLKPITKGH